MLRKKSQDANRTEHDEMMAAIRADAERRGDVPIPSGVSTGDLAYEWFHHHSKITGYYRLFDNPRLRNCKPFPALEFHINRFKRLSTRLAEIAELGGIESTPLLKVVKILPGVLMPVELWDEVDTLVKRLEVKSRVRPAEKTQEQGKAGKQPTSKKLSRDEATEKKKAMAIWLVLNDSELSDREIARQSGCSPGLLCKFEKYQTIARSLRDGGQPIRRIRDKGGRGLIDSPD